MSAKLSILVVDDDEVTRKLLREVLEKSGYSVQLAASGEDAVRAIKKERFPIVLSDIRMIEMDGMAVLREVNKVGDGTAVILMTGFGSMEGAVEAIQEGAFDYVSKPFKIDALKAVVARAAKHWESLYGSTSRSGELQTRGKLEVSDKALIGKSPMMVEVYKTLARASMSSSTVLVMGESGTGKELVAHAIHDNSPRRHKRFIAVNCGVLSGLEQGTIEDADGGTLFLDEVGDVTPTLQIDLLHMIQGDHKADVRVIAATHLDLEALVRAGKFREDLFYRLKVISIELPPLRQRMEDLSDLAGHFLARYAERNKKQVSHISDEAMNLLKTYSWPGNIRELEHAIERAVAMTNGLILFPEDFPPEISRQGHESVMAGASAGIGVTSLEDMEKVHIMKVLLEAGFNKSRASETLGIDRATLYRKAQRYGIDLRGK